MRGATLRPEATRGRPARFSWCPPPLANVCGWSLGRVQKTVVSYLGREKGPEVVGHCLRQPETPTRFLNAGPLFLLMSPGFRFLAFLSVIFSHYLGFIFFFFFNRAKGQGRARAHASLETSVNLQHQRPCIHNSYPFSSNETLAFTLYHFF